MNVIVRPKRFEANRPLLREAPVLVVDGILQREQGVINVMGDRFTPLVPRAGADYVRSHDFC